MKIKELIDELQKYDPEIECVGFEEHCSGCCFSFLRWVGPIKINKWGDRDENGKEVLYLSVS